MIPPRGTTWDNRQLPEWPERRIVELVEIPNPLGDGEPSAQRAVLQCGHWLINSYGIWGARLEPGGTLRCRTCFVRGAK
jgi:hypothetical protein